MDVAALREALDENVAGLMLTNPNTLGLFDPHIREISDLVHSVDGLMYYDGANLNPLLGKCRPGDMGFDIVHVNLHKTFATPHGGGGPGAGPVGVTERLAKYLPISIVRERADGSFYLDYDLPQSIGYIAPFYGNFGIILRAYAYILRLGREGLLRVAEHATLNANYVMEKLQDALPPGVRRRLQARMRLLGATPGAAGRPRDGYREGAHRPRVPSADGVLPAHGARGDDGRADGDGVEGDARRVHRGDDRDRAVWPRATRRPSNVPLSQPLWAGSMRHGRRGSRTWRVWRDAAGVRAAWGTTTVSDGALST